MTVRSYANVINVFTELSPTSSRTAAPAPSTAGRNGTLSLELQSALKFGLAVCLGAAAVWGSMPTAAAALVLVIAVVLAARALLVLGHDPSSPRMVRPREHAHCDGALAIALGLIALAIAASGATLAAVATGAAALALAALRLRTRYVA